jgi:hypothetical protein
VVANGDAVLARGKGLAGGGVALRANARANGEAETDSGGATNATFVDVGPLPPTAEGKTLNGTGAAGNWSGAPTGKKLGTGSDGVAVGVAVAGVAKGFNPRIGTWNPK